ncbi:helix-turn-helix transcriptional regulator [Sulfurimonas sp.]|jgi:transcriptional regulator with XRE-family HTH domain|uniref:helix-turn-helix domain-containing protein n=1 Tax=Sulfurimonas sp. TaxID=2022749 RepID=UPI0025D15EE7|nr:helix-turn-helix transcriptional regulator [Sulfurimonas sp.]MCK9473981.1 helix-turn-helix domain-containing protein [Sulfurimonas sp.]
MKNYKLIFGQNIKNKRKEKNLSQEQLAELSSLHRTYIGSVERGERNISLENIVLLAKALKIESCLLLKGIE